MNVVEKEKARMLLRSMFGDRAEVSLGKSVAPPSGTLEESIDARVSFAGITTSLVLLKAKAGSMASLRDLVLIAAGMGEKHGQPIIWAPGLSEAKQDYLRNEKVPFFDDAGNAWISNDLVHVDIRGRKIPKKESITAHQANIFSDKATIVMRILLESGPMGVREISRTAADEGFPLTPGYVSKVVSSLEAQGYGVKDKNGLVILRRKADMLADWTHSYRNLSPAQAKRFFLAVPDMEALVRGVAEATEGLALLSELAATSLIDPFASFDSVFLLAKDFDAAAASLVAAGAREVDRGSNIELVLPRYRISAFWDEQVVRGCAVASDLQVYLDLTRQPRRGLEAAEHLYERKLGAMLGEEGGERE